MIKCEGRGSTWSITSRKGEGREGLYGKGGVGGRTRDNEGGSQGIDFVQTQRYLL